MLHEKRKNVIELSTKMREIFYENKKEYIICCTDNTQTCRKDFGHNMIVVIT
uniref:Uncharacterized protein n=1 Tax=Arion vulgaris TaxID=1028688 RepID=A0A0B7BAN5_9EUPU